jgi:hypothetical protein
VASPLPIIADTQGDVRNVHFAAVPHQATGTKQKQSICKHVILTRFLLCCGVLMCKGLSKFIAKMRALYKRRKLHDNQIQLLDSIGFRWNLQSVYDEIWDDNFDHVVAYFKKFGNIDLPENDNLTSFVRNSGRLYAARKLAGPRRDKWEKLLLAVDSGDLTVLDLDISS